MRQSLSHSVSFFELLPPILALNTDSQPLPPTFSTTYFVYNVFTYKFLLEETAVSAHWQTRERGKGKRCPHSHDYARLYGSLLHLSRLRENKSCGEKRLPTHHVTGELGQKQRLSFVFLLSPAGFLSVPKRFAPLSLPLLPSIRRHIEFFEANLDTRDVRDR